MPTTTMARRGLLTLAVAALAAALAAPGPALVDVRVDPGSYPAQIKALRG